MMMKMMKMILSTPPSPPYRRFRNLNIRVEEHLSNLEPFLLPFPPTGTWRENLRVKLERWVRCIYSIYGFLLLSASGRHRPDSITRTGSIHHPIESSLLSNKYTQVIAHLLERRTLPSYPSGAPPPTHLQHSWTSARPSLRSELKMLLLGRVITDAHALKGGNPLGTSFQILHESRTPIKCVDFLDLILSLSLDTLPAAVPPCCAHVHLAISGNLTNLGSSRRVWPPLEEWKFTVPVADR